MEDGHFVRAHIPSNTDVIDTGGAERFARQHRLWRRGMSDMELHSRMDSSHQRSRAVLVVLRLGLSSSRPLQPFLCQVTFLTDHQLESTLISWLMVFTDDQPKALVL